ncbi:unnamed protein product [Symbiodinium natans]|uniref:Uncharacterized protein n=1 Tax=Symbiodinium natans TaxID=878477 RepID=A0A812UYI7_9DINO|nr:unnamed protein product [Symbiodinium natans]
MLLIAPGRQEFHTKETEVRRGRVRLAHKQGQEPELLNEHSKLSGGNVQMVTDVIQGVGEDFEKSIENQKSEIANCESVRAEREATVKEAKEELEAKKSSTQEKKYALAADAQADPWFS